MWSCSQLRSRSDNNCLAWRYRAWVIWPRQADDYVLLRSQTSTTKKWKTYPATSQKINSPERDYSLFFSRQQNLCKEAQIEELFMVFKTTSMSFEAWVKLFICFSPFFICKFWEIPNTLKGVGTVTLTNDQICSRYIHKWLTVEEREQLEF